MKKISEEEASKLPIKGIRNSSVFYSAIINLKVGENLIIEKKEWNKSKTPGRICRYIEKKFGVKYDDGELFDKSGWRVKRVK